MNDIISDKDDDLLKNLLIDNNIYESRRSKE